MVTQMLRDIKERSGRMSRPKVWRTYSPLCRSYRELNPVIRTTSRVTLYGRSSWTWRLMASAIYWCVCPLNLRARK